MVGIEGEPGAVALRLIWALLAMGGLLAAGLLIGSLVAGLRARSKAADQIAEAQAEAARAATRIEMLESESKRLAAEGQALRCDLEGERRARAVAETQVESERKNIAEQREQFERSKKQLEDSFAALSSHALDRNSRLFQEQAKKALELILENAKGDLSKRQEQMGGLITPLGETLKRYETELRALETKRTHAYASLEEQLKALGSAQEQLTHETKGLIGALRGHKARGRWGELTLRRVAELAGMSQYCDFDEQASVETGGQTQRPDMVVRLPNGRSIAVDAKAPMSAYLDAVEAQDEATRSQAMTLHARNVRDHLKALGQKAYWAQFDDAPELVVMFIPGESFFSAAIETAPDLIEFGAKNRVVVSTPTTLIALLRAIEFGWRQEKVAESAREISKIGAEMHDRIRIFAGHLANVGKSLDKSVDAYNRAVSSLESRILPTARRFEELGANGGSPIDQPQSVDAASKRITSVDLLGDGPSDDGETD